MGNKSSKKKLPKEDLDFLTSNTKFTKNEIKDWYRGFMVSLTLLISPIWLPVKVEICCYWIVIAKKCYIYN